MLHIIAGLMVDGVIPLIAVACNNGKGFLVGRFHCQLKCCGAVAAVLILIVVNQSVRARLCEGGVETVLIVRRACTNLVRQENVVCRIHREVQYQRVSTAESGVFRPDCVENASCCRFNVKSIFVINISVANNSIDMGGV